MNLLSKPILENLYDCYNRREYIHPDPLEFLYDYKDLKDREIVALIASSLAYGKVTIILKSVSTILNNMKPSPAEYLKHSTLESLCDDFKGFKHRFTTDKELASFLFGISCVIKDYGSLYECLQAGIESNNNNDAIIETMNYFCVEILKQYHSEKNSLLPLPSKGSACKRLNLFLRWMTRNDDVDPGGWDLISPSKLIYPLDTHMHKLGISLKLTTRKQGDLCTAIEVTEAFKKLVPEDPVKYDFALTRLGIRNDTDMEAFVRKCKLGRCNHG